MSKILNKNYYIFDGDVYKTPYELADKISTVFNTINLDKPTGINVYYGYATFLTDISLSCVFLPVDELSICIGQNDITFNPEHKVIDIKTVKEEVCKRVFYRIYVKIYDKG